MVCYILHNYSSTVWHAKNLTQYGVLYSRLGQLYQNFEIEKYTVCGTFYQKNGEAFKKKNSGTTGLLICMDLRIFASCIQHFLRYSLKIWQKVVLLKYFKFCYYKYCKKFFF